jgi:hypothetical protein
MAETKQQRDAKLAEDKKKLAAEKEAREKQAAATAKAMGRPTPTQEELDLIMLGNHPELSDDGSGPDPNHPSPLAQTKHVEASHGSGGYSTRQSSASSSTRARTE